MKQRIISALAGLVLLAVILFMYDTLVFNIAVTAVAVMAVYEVLCATKYVKNKTLAVMCILFSAFVPWFRFSSISYISTALCFTFAAALFILLLKKHKTMRIEEVGLSFLVSLIVPLAFSTLIALRDNNSKYVGLFYILLSLGVAWFNDSGAYFAGRAFGKHKLCPEISPKKTVEGAIGGIIANVVLNGVYANVFALIVKNKMGMEIEINWLALCIFAAIGAVLGIIGDLSASIVKRQCAIKDFGNIMPGHGGVLDRFDSWLFVGPFLYSFIQFFPIIK